MKNFLKEIMTLWWVEAGVALKDPKSEASIKALKTILREDLELDDIDKLDELDTLDRAIGFFRSDLISRACIDMVDSSSATLEQRCSIYFS